MPLRWKGENLMDGPTRVGSVKKLGRGPLGVSFDMEVRGKRIGQCGGGDETDAKARARKMVRDLCEGQK